MAMRDKFSEYYPPSPDEIKHLWAEATFVFDTNALLGFLRNSSSVVDEALALIHDLHDRLWLPHQVAFEYHQNLHIVEATVFSAPSESLKAVRASASRLRQEIAEKRHPFLRELALRKIEEFERAMVRLIENKNVRDDATLRARIRHVRETIDREFVEIGDPYDDKAMEKIFAEGKVRYERRVPPGYMDEKDKADTPVRKYGDLIVWKQILAHANTTQKPIIFITNDKKEDWWLIQSGRTVGPHPLLRREMKQETGQEYYAYTIEQFVEYGVPELQNRKLTQQAESDAKVSERTEEAILRDANERYRNDLVSLNELLQESSRSDSLFRAISLGAEEPTWFKALGQASEPEWMKALKAVNEPEWMKASKGVNEPEWIKALKAVNEPEWMKALRGVNEPEWMKALQAVNEPEWMKALKQQVNPKVLEALEGLMTLDPAVKETLAENPKKRRTAVEKPTPKPRQADNESES